MTIRKKAFDQGIKLKPTTEALTEKGELAYDSSDDKLKYREDGATRTVVNTDEAQTLTNKTINSASNPLTIDADNATISNLEVDNLKSGVLDTDLSAVSGSHDTLPSAKAVKDYVDTQVQSKDAASEISFTDSPAFPGTPATVQDALNELNDKVDANATSGSGDLSSHISDVSTHGISVAIVGTTETQTLTNKTLTSPTITGASIQTPSRLDIKQDTEANLTTYALTASNGQLVFATDTKKVYHVKDTLLAEIGGGGSGGTSVEITQASHGFIVGDGIYHNGTSWVKGQSNASSTLARFVVFSVPSANQFVAYSFGRVNVPTHGFTVGNFYYLSPSTAGLPTLTEPTSASHYSNPLFFVESSSILIAFVYRPLKAATNLDDLADVSTSGATNGQALIFNGSSWSPADVVQNAGDVIYDNSSSGLTSIDIQSVIDEIDVDIDDLNTLTGVAKNAQNLGTFTGTTISDSLAIKPAIQSLETAHETLSGSLATHISDTTTHGTTGDILGTSDTQVITNKDIDGGTAANNRRITVPKDTRANLDSLTRKAGTTLFDTTNDCLLIDNGTGLLELDTNVSIKNYIKYSNADRSISGWATYADAAQTTPVDGTAGTATSTLTRSSSSPLRGLYSFLFSKPASNEQGEGFSYDFTIDSADKNNVLEISFDYDASSANYADDYMSVFIYDVTNSQLIRFNGEELKGKTNGKFLAFFQASQSTSYRLIAHVATSTTTAWDVKFDNFFVGPSKDVSISNTNITAWTSYTPTTQSFGTLTNQNFQWRRNGQNIEIMGYFTIGTTTAAESRIYLPNGYNTLASLPTVQTCGTFVWSVSGNPHLHLFPLMEASKTYFVFGYVQTTGSQLTKLTDPTGIGMNGHTASFTVSIPVKEFSAADITNAEYSGRFQTCTLRLASDQTISSSLATKVAFATVVKDTNGMADTSNNRIYARESGFYDLAFGSGGSGLDLNERIAVDVRKNGSSIRIGGSDSSGDNQFWSTLMNLKSIELLKGDYIEIYLNSDSDASYTLAGDDGFSWFTLTKTDLPVEMVKANEVVYVDAAGNGGGSITGSSGNIDFTEITDSHGTWNGTTFTSPSYGDYLFNVSVRYNTPVGGRAVYFYVDGSLVRTIKYSNESLLIYPGTILYRLNKGQTVNIRHSDTQTLTNSTDSHYLTIRKLN